ncbi:hypothetical protein B0J13DRAFT_630038 [Dactylonectria estremocensis]|uniref:LysM domain-containing protein n=1 Tax=Dactylonectria estremocensis TaxID=1079267 RepID=A0A9P9DG47_9HYPO|nr:hypothetical protein B0J13DRAFT_630038 [Dactylonectria estremocensis]
MAAHTILAREDRGALIALGAHVGVPGALGPCFVAVPNRRRTCIKDGDRWCNIWAFENSSDNDSGNSSSAVVTATASVDMCDNCIIKPFQFMAGNSYSYGFALQANYSTLTQSCSKTSFPLATTATEEPSTTDPVSTCSGEEYTIQAGDTCQSISEANDVATAWMLYDNGLQAFCAGFPDEGEKICIVNQCKTYTIQANDTCQGKSPLLPRSAWYSFTHGILFSDRLAIACPCL